MLGGDAGIDRDAGDALGEFLVIHPVELMPHDDPIPGVEDAQLTGDGTGRVRMIAGDHHGANASALAALDRVEGLGPGWVLQADQPQEGEVLLDLFRSGRLVEWPLSQGQHTQGIVRHKCTRLEHAGAVTVGQRCDLLRGPDAGAPLKHHLRGAFDKGPGAACPRRMTVMRLRSESNGRVPRRGISASMSSRVIPPLAATTKRATSVGSPTTVGWVSC